MFFDYLNKNNTKNRAKQGRHIVTNSTEKLKHKCDSNKNYNNIYFFLILNIET